MKATDRGVKMRLWIGGEGHPPVHSQKENACQLVGQARRQESVPRPAEHQKCQNDQRPIEREDPDKSILVEFEGAVQIAVIVSCQGVGDQESTDHIEEHHGIAGVEAEFIVVIEENRLRA
jgi:hypothetical protein